MADIITNTLQIGSNNLILRDADAQEQLVTVKDGLSAVESDVTDLKEDISQVIDSAYVTDTASGSIASFPDGADNIPVKSLTVDIEPVQDLHGQDSPYPAGGGKNLLDASKIVFANYESDTTRNGITLTKNSDGSFKLSGTVTAETRLTFNPNMALGSGSYTLSITGGTGSTLRFISNGKNGLNYTSEFLDGTFTKTYTVTDNAVYEYMYLDVQNGATVNSTIYVQLEKGSTATAWSPYENICPISGHTSAVVTRTGVNLFNKATITDGYALVSTTGEIEENTNCFVTDYISVKEGVTYYIPNRGTSRACVYNPDKTYAQRVSTDSGAITWTAPIDGYIRLTSNKTVTTADDFQISIGSSAVAYEPYNGQTYTIDLDGTRYGGTLDVGTGVLTVDRAIVDMGSLSWVTSSTNLSGIYRMFSSSISDIVKKLESNSVIANTVCSTYKTVAADSTYLNIVGVAITRGGAVSVYDERFNQASDVESFKAAMSGQYMTYELAEPFTVQLTANDITTLLGQNNIWADTGNVEVEYRADTALYIQKMLNA